VKDYIETRVLQEANYIIDNKATVRQAAEIFKISKSTVYKDITTRLSNMRNNTLLLNVQMVLMENKAERHLRGGEATKIKYEEIKES